MVSWKWSTWVWVLLFGLAQFACTGDGEENASDPSDATSQSDPADVSETTDPADPTAATDDPTDPSGTSLDDFEVIECPALPEAAGCTVTDLTPGVSSEAGLSFHLKGRILAPGAVYEGGTVAIDSTGHISCVGCDCALPQSGAVAEISCATSVVSPGLINTHDHIGWIQQYPANWGDERYEHRHDWRKGRRGHTPIAAGNSAGADEKIWGELRQLMSGTTSMAGSGGATGLLRNVDNAGEMGEIGQNDVDNSTFPLGDSSGSASNMLTDSCAYPRLPDEGVLNEDSWSPHISEGIDAEARNEFLCISSTERGGVDVTESNGALIHSIALHAIDGSELAANGTSVIWSPRSNISLYGNTAPVTMLAQQGVQLALGTDWILTGSMNMLRELQCAASLNQDQYGGYFTHRALWEMATGGAAGAFALDDALGALRSGLRADLAIYEGRGLADPFEAVVTAGAVDVRLVMRGGETLYGDTTAVDNIRALTGDADCDAIETGVCGEARSVCLDGEIGKSYHALAAVNSGSYPLFHCETPADEPSCVPARVGEYSGVVTSADPDGDGVEGSADNCPAVFNPIRPVDNGAQGDFDEDGLGDVCDPCPLDANTSDCSVPDPNDRDQDGIENLVDNCPSTSNADQLDSDNDGTGDVCDSCPNAPNPGGAGCPTSIYAIKTGGVTEGSRVLTTGVVTAVLERRFFMQVPEANWDTEHGVLNSGIYVYVSSSASESIAQMEVGDLVQVDATFAEYYGQLQLSGVSSLEILASQQDVPDPVEVLPSDVMTGSSTAAAHEAILIQVSGEVTALSAPLGAGDQEPNGEFVLSGLRVNDLLYQIENVEMGDMLTLVGPLRIANGDYKIEPRSEADVSFDGFSAPYLSAMGPETTFLEPGENPQSGQPALWVELNREAGAGGVLISLNSSDPELVRVPESILIAEGEKTAEIMVEALGVAEAGVTLSATFEQTVFTAQVVVLDPLRAPALLPIANNHLVLPPNGTAEVILNLNMPAGSSGTQIQVTGGDNLVTAHGVTVAPFATQVSIGITAEDNPGVTELYFTTGHGDTQIVTVEVSLAAMVGMVLSEVFVNPTGSDDGSEWIEIYNGTGTQVDLSGYSLGFVQGGNNQGYAAGGVQLTGIIEAGACIVVGGPLSTAANHLPTIDLEMNFTPDIQNNNKAIGLFDVARSSVSPQTVPVDAVVYGDNSQGYMDDDGTVPATGEVDNPGSGNSLEQLSSGWVVQLVPTPGVCAIQN